LSFSLPFGMAFSRTSGPHPKKKAASPRPSVSFEMAGRAGIPPKDTSGRKGGCSLTGAPRLRYPPPSPRSHSTLDHLLSAVEPSISLRRSPRKASIRRASKRRVGHEKNHSRNSSGDCIDSGRAALCEGAATELGAVRHEPHSMPSAPGAADRTLALARTTAAPALRRRERRPGIISPECGPFPATFDAYSAKLTKE